MEDFNMHYIYIVILLLIGILILLTTSNLIKKIIGLGLFQSAILLFYISLGKVDGAIAPIIDTKHGAAVLYSSPLPQVLMLTAIVVGLATFAVAMNLIIRINEQFSSINEDQIIKIIETDESTS
jgi:multicomponent Na+:H+ antiporter subunit C